jgi:hypothetical protein
MDHTKSHRPNLTGTKPMVVPSWQFCISLSKQRQNSGRLAVFPIAERLAAEDFRGVRDVVR